ENDTILSRKLINTDAIMQELSASNGNVREITENLKILTSDMNSGNGTLQALYKDPQMAEDFRQTFKNLNSVSDQVLKVGGSLQKITNQMQQGNGAIGELLNDTTLGRNLAKSISTLN